MVRLDVANGRNKKQIEEKLARNEDHSPSRYANRNCHAASERQKEEKEEYSNFQDYLQVTNSREIDKMHETINSTTGGCMATSTTTTPMTMTTFSDDHEQQQQQQQQLSQMFSSQDDGQFDFSFDNDNDHDDHEVTSVKGSLASANGMYNFDATMQMSDVSQYVGGDVSSQQQLHHHHHHNHHNHQHEEKCREVGSSLDGMTDNENFMQQHQQQQSQIVDEIAATTTNDDDEAFIAICLDESAVLNNDPSRKYYTNKLYQPLNGHGNTHNNHHHQHHHQHHHNHLTQQPNDGMLLDQIVDDELLLYQELQDLKRSKKTIESKESLIGDRQNAQPQLNRILQDDDDGDAEDDDDAQDSLDHLQLTKIIEDFDSYPPSPLFSVAHHNGDPLLSSISSSNLGAELRPEMNSTSGNTMQQQQQQHQQQQNATTGIKRPHEELQNDSYSQDLISLEDDDGMSSSAQDDGSASIITSGGSRRSRSSSSSNPNNKYRRCTANARERIRMQEINQAFEKLKKVVPVELIQQVVSGDESDQTSCNQTSSVASRRGGNKSSSALGQDGQSVKLTKITTLKLAVSYISRLSELLTSTSDGNCADSSHLRVPVIRSNDQSASVDGRSKEGPAKRARRRKSRSTDVKRNPETKAPAGKLMSTPPAGEPQKVKSSFGSTTGEQQKVQQPALVAHHQVNGGQLAIQRIVLHNQSDLQHHQQQQQQQHQSQQVILTNGIINRGLSCQPSQQNGAATTFIPIQQQQQQQQVSNSHHIGSQQQPQQLQIISQTSQNGHDRAFVTPVAVAILGIPSGGFNRGSSEAQPIQILGITNPNQLVQRQQQHQFQPQRNGTFNLIPQPAQPQQVTLTLNDINGLSVLRLANNPTTTTSQHDNVTQFIHQQHPHQLQTTTTTSNGRFNYTAIQPTIQLAPVQGQSMRPNGAEMATNGSGQLEFRPAHNNLILSNISSQNQSNLQYQHQHDSRQQTPSASIISSNNNSNNNIITTMQNNSSTKDGPLIAGSLAQQQVAVNQHQQQVCFKTTPTTTTTSTPTTLTGIPSDCLQNSTTLLSSQGAASNHLIVHQNLNNQSNGEANVSLPSAPMQQRQHSATTMTASNAVSTQSYHQQATTTNLIYVNNPPPPVQSAAAASNHSLAVIDQTVQYRQQVGSFNQQQQQQQYQTQQVVVGTNNQPTGATESQSVQLTSSSNNNNGHQLQQHYGGEQMKFVAQFNAQQDPTQSSSNLNVSEDNIRQLVASIATSIPRSDDTLEGRGSISHINGSQSANGNQNPGNNGVNPAQIAADNQQQQQRQVAGSNNDNQGATKSASNNNQQQPTQQLQQPPPPPPKRTYRFHNYDGNMITNHLYSNHHHHDKSSSRLSAKQEQQQQSQLTSSSSATTTATTTTTSSSSSSSSLKPNQHQQQQQPPSQRSRQNSLSSTCSTTSSLSSSLSPSNVTSPNLGPLLQTIMIRSPSLDCSNSSGNSSSGSSPASSSGQMPATSSAPSTTRPSPATKTMGEVS